MKIMSLESVKQFYERLAQDESFHQAIQSVQSKDECRQIVKQAGFDFTLAEFEEYTSEFVINKASDSSINELNELELSAVVGGFMSLNPLPPYGHSPELWRSSSY
jgi:predicted ribosomally synthesized peptide with nif11-like leader